MKRPVSSLAVGIFGLAAFCLALPAGVRARDARGVSYGKAAPKEPPRELEPRVVDQGGKDDADARWEATLEWFGGEPTVQYLDRKKELAREELKRWSWSFPGQKALRPLDIPGSGQSWTNIGPRGGRTAGRPAASRDIDVDSGRLAIQGIVTHPTNAATLYLATAGGGVWKTTNADLAGAGDWTWSSITDGLPNATATGNIACGALAMSPTDPETLYLGLGDFYQTPARGLYKTTNGGGNWTELGAVGDTTAIHRILPLNATTILVGGNDGLYRSTNGGTSFSLVPLGETTDRRKIWSVVRCGPNLILTAQTKDAAQTGSIWYSQDNGASWQPSALNGVPVPDALGRITVEASPASGGPAAGLADFRVPTIRCLAPSTDHRVVFLRTTDCGQTWTALIAVVAASTDLPVEIASDEGQGWYNQALAVDPDNTDRIFAGAQNALYRTTNGGQDWTTLTSWWGASRVYAHADFQTAAWSKTGPKTLFVGNDGGLAVLPDPYRDPPTGEGILESDTSFVDNRRNKGISSHLVYNVGSTTAADSLWKVSTGMQDNGARLRRGAGSDYFDEKYQAGDGFGTLWHPTDGNRVLISSYHTNIYFSTDGGENFLTPFWFPSSLFPFLDFSSCTAPFYTKLVRGLAPDHAFTFSKYVIYGSPDFGQDWYPLALSLGSPLRVLAVSRTDPYRYAVANQDGEVRVSDPDEGWVSLGTPEADFRASALWYDTNDPGVLYAASVALNTARHHLWKKVGNGGWQPLDGAQGNSNGFPFGIPVHVIQNDPANSAKLLAGTDFGVYISTNSGQTWSRYGQGLPLVSVRDLYVAPNGSLVRAATFGRGVWEITN